MTKLISTLLACLTLAGCAATYTFNGQRYASKEELVSASDRMIADAVNSIQPLQQPVSKRTLLFALPSERTFHTASVATFTRVNGRPIGMGEEIMLTNINSVTFKTARSLFDAIKRRNIYQNVRYLDLDTMTAELQATPSEDVLYFYKAPTGDGQYYYSTAKSGKQVFSFDRGAGDMNARTKAFVQSVEVFSIRD